MKLFNIARRYGAQIRNGATGAVALVGATVALATPSPFDEAITDATAAVTDYAGALIGLAAVGVVFMIAIKYVKKIRGAA